ncbi:MAG: hypothetical protein FJ271_15040 [Planctomycetes bacterium]|nr:hypothetical protein [Planctomycetota bacterium]
MSRVILLVVASIFFLVVAPARADEKDDNKLFQRVMQRLLSSELADKEYTRKFFWPPHYFIKPQSKNEVNAYATAHKEFGATVDAKSGKIKPVVMVTEGFLAKVVKGNEDVLAAVMGHELAHLTKDHVTGQKGATEFLFLAFSREHEIEADLAGMRYAVAAGYPYRNGVGGMAKVMKSMPGYSSFEGLHASHPSWDERLAMLDRQQSQLWTSMASFRNGNFFLELEQYLPAQHCFKAVLKEFPECHEAWANLGYVQLMRYLDGLETEDLRRYDIGQVVVGGFYTRPASLESKVRGIDEKLWKDAVRALDKALKLQPNLVLPRACLGLAHLVHPEGRDVKKAKKAFADALACLDKDGELKKNALARSSLLFNAAVVDLAAGAIAEAGQKFNRAGKEMQEVEYRPLMNSLQGALVYNKALIDSQATEKEHKEQALQLFKYYLMQTSRDSAWWPLAYERYSRLAKELKVDVVAPDKLISSAMPRMMRMVASVSVGKGAITLSEPIQSTVEQLGRDAGVAIPLYPGAKFMRWRFAAHGIDVLAKEKVLAIFLTGSRSPALRVQEMGAATKTRDIRVGMPETELKDILKQQPVDKAQRFIADPRAGYHFYPSLGLAVRYHDSRVAELALAQIPRLAFMENTDKAKDK